MSNYRRSIGLGHISIVNKRTLPVTLNNGFFATTGSIGEKWDQTLSNLFADVLRTRVNDLVFFQIVKTDNEPANYLEKIMETDKRLQKMQEDNTLNRIIEPYGFTGVFKVKSKPFWDLHPISLGENMEVESDYCIRILLEPVKYLPFVVPEGRAFDDNSDAGDLWNPKFKKSLGRGRSLTPTTPEEDMKLTRLISKTNDFEINLQVEDYPGRSNSPISIDQRLHQDTSNVDEYKPKSLKEIDLNNIALVREGKVKYEKTLEAWLMEKIDTGYPGLRDILGSEKDIKWFGNYLAFGFGGSNFDAMVIHERDIGEYKARYKISLIELKKDTVGEGDIRQVLEYSKWVSMFLAGGDISMIQPILIGNKIKDNALELAKSSALTRRPKLVEYYIENERMVINPVFNPDPEFY